MKKNKTLIAIGAIVAVILLMGGCTYNSLVGSDEGAKQALGAVQSAYQRRADLIPNLVETVKGYAAHERETYEGVVEARSKATSINLDVDNIEEYQKAQGELTSALGRLIAIGEAYPELKSNENYQTLMTEVSTTENLLMTHKKAYNTAVKQYNNYCRRFPTRFNLAITGYEKVDYQYYSTENTDKPMNLFGE